MISTAIFHIVQFFVSSLIVFGVMILAIEALFWVFRIVNPRVRVLFRYVPLFKLPIDLFLYICSLCMTLKNFNPFSCQMFFETTIYKWLPQSIQMKMGTSGELPISMWISNHFSAGVIETAVLGVCITFITFAAYKLYRVIEVNLELKRFCAEGEKINHLVQNNSLKKKIDELGIQIYASSIPVPAAGFRNSILIPKHQIDLLQKEELDAVIAHELNHLQWNDPLLRMASEVIASIFCWVPTKRWLKKLEEEQEYACDASIDRHQVDPLSLANAMVKVAKDHKTRRLEAVCFLTQRKHVLQKRIEKLVAIAQVSENMLHTLRWSVLGALLTLVVMISFRIC